MNKNLPDWESNRGPSDPQPSTNPLNDRAFHIIVVKIDLYILPQTLDQYWSTLVSNRACFVAIGNSSSAVVVVVVVFVVVVDVVDVVNSNDCANMKKHVRKNGVFFRVRYQRRPLS